MTDILNLKTYHDLECYLAEERLQLGIHGCKDVIWAELSRKGERVGVGAGNDLAKALIEAVTDYEVTRAKGLA
jgi:hypothetical protein